MPIDMFGLVIGKVQAENRGLQPPDSTQIGLVSSMMGNPVMSLVISRSLADKKVAELTPPPPPSTGEEPGGEEPGSGEPRTDFERHVEETLGKIQADLAALKAEVDALKPPPPPPPPAPPAEGGQAAPPQQAAAKESSGKAGKGGG